MNLGHAFLLMALLSLGLLGVMLKVADSAKCRPGAVNLGLFLWAAVFLSLYLLSAGRASLLMQTPGKLYVVAAVCGTLASVAILSFQTGLRYGKIATGWVIINLSTILPSLLSIVIYREPVTPLKGIALLLVIVSIVLLWKDRQIDTEAARSATSSPAKP